MFGTHYSLFLFIYILILYAVDFQKHNFIMTKYSQVPLERGPNKISCEYITVATEAEYKLDSEFALWRFWKKLTAS